MFQTFEDPPGGNQSSRRFSQLRKQMSADGLTGFIVPRTDEYQGEYVAGYAERLRWLTGFSGSAGLAIVLQDEAAIFVDGRYAIQVVEQTDGNALTVHDVIENPPAKWIETAVHKDDVVGYDPWLLTPAQVTRFAEACKNAGATLKAVEQNPIDAVWPDQPSRPSAPVEVHPTQYAGQAPDEKLAQLQDQLKNQDCAATVLTLPESIAWAFNIRGHDVAHTPVVHASAIVHAGKKADLFIDEARLPEDAVGHLSGVANIHPPAEFAAQLKLLGPGGEKIHLDLSSAPEQVRQLLAEGGAGIVDLPDACALPRARKNAIECEGARLAHRRDGAAMVRFLAWLDDAIPAGGIDEIAAAKKLEGFRRETGELKDISFDTISASGPHAALPHYRVTTATNLPLTPDQIFLVDSGGQYLDGTTDITRTIIAGTPTDEMRDRFTRVLKGMINLSTVRFPKGTTGGHLDAIARLSLWQAGLDFNHGTGHGVGSYLSVHEGPQRFSKADKTVLEPGMIISNEPGCYKEGEFGIRIENLLLVREAEPVDGGERDMHVFETLVLCPIDRRLIDPCLLQPHELEWLNAYHARVADEIGPHLDTDTANWLKQATAPISPGHAVNTT